MAKKMEDIKEKKAALCITAFFPNLDSPVNPRFGRSNYFLLLDEKGNLQEALPNPGIEQSRGAGIAAAQLVASSGVNILITGNVGPNAFGVLKASGVQIFLAPNGAKAKEVFLLWKENKLSQAEASNAAAGFGRGGGFGRGMGRGRGRGQGLGRAGQ